MSHLYPCNKQNITCPQEIICSLSYLGFSLWSQIYSLALTVPHEQKHEDWCTALKSSKDFLSFFQLNNLSNLIPSLIACELAVDSSSNWRLHVQLLEKFSCFPKCLTSDQIYYKFVPLFFRLLSSNVSFIVQCYLAVILFNPFNPLSDQHLISP